MLASSLNYNYLLLDIFINRSSARNVGITKIGLPNAMQIPTGVIAGIKSDLMGQGLMLV